MFNNLDDKRAEIIWRLFTKIIVCISIICIGFAIFKILIK